MVKKVVVKKKTAGKKTVEKKVVEDPNKKIERQFFWVVGIFVALTLSFIFVPMAYHSLVNKFEYGGVNFEKMYFGEIKMYHGVFPMVYKGELKSLHNVYFRNDPRKNNIPMNTNISLSKRIYVSPDKDAILCESATLGQVTLGGFFGALPFVQNVSTSAYDDESAELYGRPKLTCENATSGDTTVLIVKMSDKPSIEAGDNDNCFVLNIGDCKYLETTERFIMGLMAQINEKPLK